MTNREENSITTPESTNRDKKYSELLEEIIDSNRVDKKLKIVFFVVIMVVFIGILASCIVIIRAVIAKPDQSIADAATVVAGFSSVISATIVLPTIIAKHLFPENSEEVRLNFLKDIKKYDIETTTTNFDEIETADTDSNL